MGAAVLRYKFGIWQKMRGVFPQAHLNQRLVTVSLPITYMIPEYENYHITKVSAKAFIIEAAAISLPDTTTEGVITVVGNVSTFWVLMLTFLSLVSFQNSFVSYFSAWS